MNKTTVENVRKQRDDKLATIEKIRNYLVLEPNYHTARLAIETEKTQTYMNKPVYLRLSILEVSKILMCEFWYNYVKRKYGENAKLCHMYMDSFIVGMKTNYIHKGIEEDVQTRFDTSNYE